MVVAVGTAVRTRTLSRPLRKRGLRQRRKLWRISPQTNTCQAPESGAEERQLAFRGGGGEWTLAPLRDADQNIVGYCGNCNGHHDALRLQIVCKKQVTIGMSGLTYETLKLRMKRWIIAGIDDGAVSHVRQIARLADGK